MQYTSYLPGHHCSGDLTIDANGSVWPQFNNGVFYRSGREYNVLFQPPSIDQYLSYYRDLLRDTMLKHEAIFKYQVYELHRLYGKQRELMDEIQMRELSTNCFVSRMQCDISQTALQIPCWLLSNRISNKPSALGVEIFQKPPSLVAGKSIQAGSDLYPALNDLKELKLSSFRGKKCRKRLLDLELPAEMYMDTDEGERLEEKEATEIHPLLHDPSINISNSSQKSNVILSEGASSNLNLSYFFDLNEPIQLDEPTTSTSLMYCNTSSTQIMHQDQDPSGNSTSKSPALKKIVHNIVEEKGSSLTSGLQVLFAEKLPLSCNDGTSFGSKFARNNQHFFDSNKETMFSTSMDKFVAYSPSLGSSTSHMSCKTDNQRSDELYCVARCVRDSHHTKSVVDLNLNAMFNSLPETEASQGKVKFTDGLVNLDLNVMPSSSLPETEASQERIESIDGKNGLHNSVGQLNQVGYNPNYDGKIIICPDSLGHHTSSIQISACSSIISPSSSSENEDIQNDEKTYIPASILPCKSSNESEKCAKEDTYLATKSGKEISLSETFIDLPFNFGEGEHSQVATVTDGVGTGLEAPVSPENKEHSPPREDSEDNQSEKLEDPNKDLDRIAAEAIISISLSGERPCLKTSISGPLEATVDCLNWFAGIVSSVGGDVENELEDLLSNAPGGPCNQLAFNALEHLETMTTFKFTGTKVKDTFCMTIDKKSKIVGDIISPSLQGRRRARNAECDLTENIRPIKDLTVHRRTAPKTVKGKRNAGKIGRAKAKRRSKNSCPNLASRRVCSLLRQHASEREQSFLQSCLFGWGKKSRRQKHQRVQN